MNTSAVSASFNAVASSTALRAPRPKVDELMPYYQELVEEFFPDPLRW